MDLPMTDHDSLMSIPVAYLRKNEYIMD
jgi:hypothetical protein